MSATTDPAGIGSTPAAMRFDLPGGGHALFTTRAAGNLSTLRGPGHERGREERERLCAELGLGWLCASRQVHGTTVQRVVALAETGMLVDSGMLAETGTRPEGACHPASVKRVSPESVAGECLPASVGAGGEAVALDADGHATTLRGVGVMVLVADCLPVVLGSEGGAVAALHAGWRGLAAGVLEEGVRALRELAGDGEITAVIGPGAGLCCYEVGEEVHAAFDSRPAGRERPASGPPTRGERPESGPLARGERMEPGPPGRRGRRGRNLDLPGLARARLEAAGVAHVEDVGVCTLCSPHLYSHRREGLDAGRQAGVAWLS